MIQVKHESATISLKYNHNRALKDISESLEQLPSSKDTREAPRVFWKITNNVCPYQKGVSSKDDCDKLKGKESYNTRLQAKPVSCDE